MLAAPELKAALTSEALPLHNDQVNGVREQIV